MEGEKSYRKKEERGDDETTNEETSREEENMKGQGRWEKVEPSIEAKKSGFQCCFSLTELKLGVADWFVMQVLTMWDTFFLFPAASILLCTLDMNFLKASIPDLSSHHVQLQPVMFYSYQFLNFTL